MKWLTFDIQSEPGFRLNLTDLLFIALLCGLAAFLYSALPDNSLFWFPLYLGASFFLFCNVFRIGSRLEIFWYVPFVPLAAYAVYTMELGWFWRFALPLLELIKWTLISYRIRRGPYIGVGYAWLARQADAP